MSTCGKCGREIEPRQWLCGDCLREYRRQYREENREYLRQLAADNYRGISHNDRRGIVAEFLGPDDSVTGEERDELYALRGRRLPWRDLVRDRDCFVGLRVRRIPTGGVFVVRADRLIEEG